MYDDKLVIAIDFDGTIVEHAYPGIGRLYEYAKDCINSLYDSGRYYIIIWSTRVGSDQQAMTDFLNTAGIRYHGVNENCPAFKAKLAELGQQTPRKIYYDIIVDDRSLWGYSINFDIDWPLIVNLIELEYKMRKGNVA